MNSAEANYIKQERSRIGRTPLTFLLQIVMASAKFITLVVQSPFHSEKRRALQFFLRNQGVELKKIDMPIPQKELQEAFPCESGVRLWEPGVANGNVTLFELCTLNSATQFHQPSTIFEIGTFDGRTTLNLTRTAGAAVKTWTLDLPPDELEDVSIALTGGEAMFVRKKTSGGRFTDTPEQARITQLYGNSIDFDFSPYHGKCDLVFVDGSHAFEYVLADSRNARLLTRENGLIIWHDYGEWPEVALALNYLHQTEKDQWNFFRIKGTTLVFSYRKS